MPACISTGAELLTGPASETANDAMRTRSLRTGAAVLAFALGCGSGSVLAEDKAELRARTDYLLHCSGCHGQDGAGRPVKGIPKFLDQIGYFPQLPEGRELLMQVPGLLSSGLPDGRAAAVTNYIVRRFAGPSLPPEFVPYTAAEAQRLRADRPADITAKRYKVYLELVQKGYPVQ